MPKAKNLKQRVVCEIVLFVMACAHERGTVMQATVKLFVAMALAVGLPSAATAGPHDDAWVAYQRGDTPAALEILIPLANQGDSSAQNNLGVIYSRGQFGDGRGAPQDYPEAVKWFNKAAQRGVPDAYFNLGYLYYYGRGVPQDYRKAVDWLDMANTAGHPRAAKLRNEVLSKMSPSERAEARKPSSDEKPSNSKPSSSGRLTRSP